MEKIIDDKELGPICLRTSSRARRYSLKISKGRIIATMPVGGDVGRLMIFIRENREQLKAGLAKFPARDMLTPHSKMQTTTFSLNIFTTDRSNLYIKLSDGQLNIACPISTDFSSHQVQDQLRSVLEKALRHEAKVHLPQRLSTLAERHGFRYSDVKINSAKTRWGSCTSRGVINLSLSLMILPWHLVDYVLLHELCHTRQMNHSEAFWQLLDSVSDNRAKALRAELRTHKIPF